MSRYRTVKTNFTNGELDPALQARVDLQAYRNGAERMRNVLVIPQGGAIRRPGLAYIDTLPNVLTAQDLSAATVTATNGGTAGNAYDDDTSTVLETTGGAGTTDPFVIAHIDLGSHKAIKFLDVIDISTDGAVSSDAEVRWQRSDDNSAWTDVGDPFDTVDQTARTRRVQATGSHRYWRLARVGSTDLSTQDFSVAEIRLWRETSTVSAGRAISFEFSTTQTYLIAVTDRNLRVYANGVRQCDVPIPHESADLATLKWTQNLDTLLLFHADYPIRRILRQGANDEWQSDEWETRNIPTNAFGLSTTGNALTLSVASIGTGRTATAASGIFTSDMTNGWQITALDGGRAKITGYTSATEVTVEITEAFDGTSVTAGEWFLQEPVWSAARGYPVSGTFFQGRLWIAGSKSLPSSIWASRSGDPTDFNTLRTLDSYGIEADANTDDVAAFYAIYAGRHLQFFSSSSEFYIPVSENDTVTPTNIVLRRTTSRGTEPGIPVLEVDGATLFLQRGGKAVREFLFVETEQAYAAGNTSLLASHLINSPVDMALRKSTSTEEADYIYVVNGDGTLATFCTLRQQEVNAWTLCETAGDFKAAAGLLEDSYFLIQREIDGTDHLFVEQFDRDLHFDAAISGGVASSSSGLGHLDGATVGIRLDDLSQADATVSSGSVTFARASEVDYEVGLRFPDVTASFNANDPYRASGHETFIRLMTPEESLPEGTQLGRKKKLNNVNVIVAQSLGIYVNGYHVPTRTFGSGVLDAPGAPVSEVLEVKSSLGWSKEKRLVVGQKDAHPMTVYGMTYEVEV